MLTKTRGGSSETEENELTVMPWGWPDSSVTVTTVMPVANRAQVLRKRLGSTGVSPASPRGVEIALDMEINLILSSVCRGPAVHLAPLGRRQAREAV